MCENEPVVDVTLLLRQIREAGPDAQNAQERLCKFVYEELKQHAKSARKRFPSDTHSTTDVVNEMFLRLINRQRLKGLENRAHFFGVAIREMHELLVDRVRRRNAEVRGGGQRPLTFGDELDELARDSDERSGVGLVALNNGLRELEKRRPRQAKIVEYKFFAGLTHGEIADLLGIATDTVKRDWRLARAFLGKLLGPDQ